MGGVREGEEMVGGLGGRTRRGRGGEREERGEGGEREERGEEGRVMWGKREEGGIA